METVVTPIESADDPALVQAFQVEAASVAADLPDFPPPDWQSFRGGLAHPWPGQATRHFLATLDGVPAGYLVVGLPTLDNTDNSHAEITVHPDYRRRGVGRALYDRAVVQARQENRKRLTGMSLAVEPNDAFARSVGAKPALTEVRRKLDLATVDDAALDADLAAAWQRASGYSVVRWRDLAPDEYLADVAYLEGRMITDMPTGDLEWEPEKVDADRMRAAGAVRQARGRRAYETGIRHDASGRVVAWTAIAFSASQHEYAWQNTTIVDPEHRGHRLGLISKIENLRYVRENEPTLRIINTWNAAENSYMIAINEQLGFRVVDTWTNWQQDI